MTPPLLFAAALLWRAIWRSTLVGALVGGCYAALAVFLMNGPRWGDVQAGLSIGLLLGGFVGLVGGLLLGVMVLLLARSAPTAPIRAGGVGVGLLAAGLLVFVLTAGQLGGLLALNGLLLVGVPALLVLGWMVWEARRLSSWATRQRQAHP